MVGVVVAVVVVVALMVVLAVGVVVVVLRVRMAVMRKRVEDDLVMEMAFGHSGGVGGG